MKAVFSSACAIFLMVSLAGCSTIRAVTGNDAPGIDVTRTHLGGAIARGPIAVEPFEGADANRPEFGNYAVSVRRQLMRLGWTPVGTVGQSEQVALVDVRQDAAGGLTLDTKIKRRSDGSMFWEGKAVSAAPAPDRAAAVERLAEALFRDFPGESGRTITLR